MYNKTTGIAQTHHGELIQGPRMHEGRLETELITLPRYDRCAKAVFHPSPDSDDIIVMPPGKKKAQAAAHLVQQFCSKSGKCRGGHIEIFSNIPVAVGAGSSTSDILAVINALIAYYGVNAPAATKQRWIYEVEKASDPLALIMPDTTVVYGSRCGIIFESGLAPLPDMICVGFTASHMTVNTDDLVGKEDYTEKEAEEFASVRALAKKGLENGGGPGVNSMRMQKHRLSEEALRLERRMRRHEKRWATADDRLRVESEKAASNKRWPHCEQSDLEGKKS